MKLELNQEVFDKVQAAVLACLTQRLGIDEHNMTFESDVKELSGGNIYLFGHALIDIHEVFDLKVQYNPLTEFETFQTVEDVVNYFYGYLVSEHVE